MVYEKVLVLYYVQICLTVVFVKKIGKDFVNYDKKIPGVPQRIWVFFRKNVGYLYIFLNNFFVKKLWDFK